MAGNLKILQINLQHSRAASAVLCQTVRTLDISIALIQEPWASGHHVLGLGTTGGRIIYNKSPEKSRTCIYAKNGINILPLAQFCHRDITTVKLNYMDGNVMRVIVIASVYLPYDEPSPPTMEMDQLTQYCAANNHQLIIGCDANSHHTAWGSSDINARGEYLLDYIITNRLEIANRGSKPTFGNRIREEVIDLTLSTLSISDNIKKWHVSDEPSASDHKHIRYDVEINIIHSNTSFRNPKKTDWENYNRALQARLEETHIVRTTLDIELAATELQTAVIDSFKENCPIVSKNTNNSCCWWTEDLQSKRKQLRKTFNRSKRLGTWDEYHTSLTEYKNALKKAKTNSWRGLCHDVENTSEGARLHRILAKKPIGNIGTLRKPDGDYTVSGRDTLETLVRAHFPDSLESVQPDLLSDLYPDHIRREAQDWKLASIVFSRPKIEWAIRSFQPYKSPGPDGIYPVLLQKGEKHVLTPLGRLFRASLATGYIPSAWKPSRVTFIPKPGRTDHSSAKDYRPISLTSFLLKIMERLVGMYISQEALSTYPLHVNQHAYRAGKSCESALHSLVNRIERGLAARQTVLCVFLDIEGAFDNASYNSIIHSARRHGVNDTVCRWITSVLEGRRIQASLFGESMIVKAIKGCPQGGVLSPLLWNLVVDDLLEELNEKGYYAQGYADDIVIAVQGPCESTISELMQNALNITQTWCYKEGLKINPSKTTLIPFTRKRKLAKIKPPIIFGERLHIKREAKFLGVILDSKLTWNPHLQYICNKSKSALMLCRRTCGKNWGLNPKMTRWIFLTIVRPTITYASVVWWTKVDEKLACTKLSRIQRLACLCITGAMRSTPTATMEILLGLTPLDIEIKAKARVCAHRLTCGNNWVDKNNHIGHTRIVGRSILHNPIFEMGTDTLPIQYSFFKPFTLICDRSMWMQGEPDLPMNGLIWYTDGSKTANGTGAGIYGVRPRVSLSFNLGKYATVFQAEVFAILACIQENLRRGYINHNVHILSDSQAALKALASPEIKSKIVGECRAELHELARRNRVKLIWIPGHCGYDGNEEADKLAKKGVDSTFVGPEPTIGIPLTACKQVIREWTKRKHLDHWNNTPKQDIGKRLIQKVSEKIISEFTSLDRSKLRKVVGFVTGHFHFRKHMRTMGVWEGSPLCRLCGGEDETSQHIIFNCEAMNLYRYNIFGATNPEDMNLQDDLVGKLTCLIKAWERLTSAE